MFMFKAIHSLDLKKTAIWGVSPHMWRGGLFSWMQFLADANTAKAHYLCLGILYLVYVIYYTTSYYTYFDGGCFNYNIQI